MGIAEAQRWNTLGNVIMRFPSFHQGPSPETSQMGRASKSLHNSCIHQPHPEAFHSCLTGDANH